MILRTTICNYGNTKKKKESCIVAVVKVLKEGPQDHIDIVIMITNVVVVGNVIGIGIVIAIVDAVEVAVEKENVIEYIEPQVENVGSESMIVVGVMMIMKERGDMMMKKGQNVAEVKAHEVK